MLRELIIYTTSILKLTSAFPTDGATNAHAPRPQTARPLLEEYGDECDMLGGPPSKPRGIGSCVRLSLHCHCRTRYTPEILPWASHLLQTIFNVSVDKALLHHLAND